jgi:hypothetical protein
MHLRTAKGDLSLKLLHETPAQSPSQPDLHLEISATVKAFSAQGVRAWIEWPDVEAFVSELATLVQDVKGEAKLYAMSPEDFELVVANLDSRGHFGINFAVGSRLHTDNGQFQCGLRGGLEVELSQVEALLQWFHAVISRTEA